MIDEHSEVARHLPVLLNLASSFATSQREAKHALMVLESRVADTEKWLEFVRREISFEMKRGRGGEGPLQSIEPRIVNQAKLGSLGSGGARLNLGCGQIPLEGFINVDARELDGVDVVADVHALPFEAASLAAIRSAHLIEHFPAEELKRTLLPYWFSLLRPGGEFSAIVPDAETMLAEYAAGRFSFDDLRQATYGGQDYEGNFHFNMFSRVSVCESLREVGFEDVNVVAVGRRNGICYEMEIHARKPIMIPSNNGALERARA
jgi:hypothetical protein